MEVRQATRLPDTPDVGFDDLAVTITAQGRTCPAEVVAMGPFDLRLRVGSSIPLWGSFGIRMRNRFHGIDAVITGVAHWCAIVEGHWEVGAWLDEELPGDVASCYWQDMRRELRYDVNWCAVAEWPGQPPRPIQITNYSLTGLAFTCSADVNTQDEFLIRRSFDSSHAAARATACWQGVPAAGDQLVGCRLPADGGYHLARDFGVPVAATQASELPARGDLTSRPGDLS